MDAATLYAVMSVASGQRRMTTQKYPTMSICEQVAKKLRKKTSLREATYYCVKRDADADERLAVQRPRKPPTAAPQAQAQPIVGLPRDFYSGTTPKQ
jgi:hypothetical protein